MEAIEKIKKIDEAIDNVLSNLGNGIEIKEYYIDNIRIVKRSPLELIQELRRIKKLIISDMQKQKKSFKFIFGDSF
ncbi:hypothetical protein [Campylobacter pinnipediorum]|uniref:MCP-domain signal transduction protein n=1 Tax=Campylobacter pinnipediorum subsp. pinnipediorum TaxID=1660067 RepID=A0AAX0LA79_9BACT|nr:hypothetical protein [Campylobacter pinnipediorum]AQW82919.1 hypothetical protein CPIN17261_0910 [Campylobacter pinnipediorum subsp. pinnipediorum]OPA77261.1 hypothetical protein BFG04_03975 [Campylobacter pinnipediorum subsp. pinnipediorum]